MGWNELKGFLGRDFEPGSGPVGDEAARWMVEERGVAGFLESRAALYYFTTAEITGAHDRLYAEIRVLKGPCEMIDVECGVGAHGIRLARYGYVANFADSVAQFRAYVQHRRPKAAVSLPGEAKRNELALSFGGVHRYPPDEQWDHVLQVAKLGETAIIMVHLGRPLLHACDAHALEERIADQFDMVRVVTYDGSWRRITFQTPEPSEQEQPDAPQEDVELTTEEEDLEQED